MWVANVLLYAVNTASEHHDASRRWLDGAPSGADSVGFAWVPLRAFIRLSVRPGLFPCPLRPEDAVVQVVDRLPSPTAVLVHPTIRHPEILARMLARVGPGGNLVNDAHLAALAVGHRARIVSYDRDFERFDGVRRDPPEALL